MRRNAVTTIDKIGTSADANAKPVRRRRSAPRCPWSGIGAASATYTDVAASAVALLCRWPSAVRFGDCVGARCCVVPERPIFLSGKGTCLVTGLGRARGERKVPCPCSEALMLLRFPGSRGSIPVVFAFPPQD